MSEPAGEAMPFGTLDDVRSLEFLCSLTKGSKNIFEFGTFIGYTALALAMHNTEATVYTLDIGADPIYGEYEVGRYIKGVQNVVQLIGDSKTIDLSHLYGTMDLVFIDGDHSEEGCRNDLDKALLLAKQGSIIVMDDFAKKWEGVDKVIKEFSFEYPLCYEHGLIVFRRKYEITSNG